MKRRTLLLPILLAFAAPTLAPDAYGQTQLLRQVIGSGAVAAASPQHIVAGTIGQTIIGPATSSSHAAFLGFWYTYPNPGNPNAVREEYVRAVTGRDAAVRVAPNPAVDVTTLTLALPVGGDVDLRVFDGLGQERIVLLDGHREAGTTTLQLPVRDLESGDYLIVLRTGGVRSATPLRVIR